MVVAKEMKWPESHLQDVTRFSAFRHQADESIKEYTSCWILFQALLFCWELLSPVEYPYCTAYEYTSSASLGVRHERVKW
jgi:hypothetical protein